MRKKFKLPSLLVKLFLFANVRNQPEEPKDFFFKGLTGRTLGKNKAEKQRSQVPPERKDQSIIPGTSGARAGDSSMGEEGFSVAQKYCFLKCVLRARKLDSPAYMPELLGEL